MKQSGSRVNRRVPRRPDLLRCNTAATALAAMWSVRRRPTRALRRCLRCSFSSSRTTITPDDVDDRDCRSRRRRAAGWMRSDLEFKSTTHTGRLVRCVGLQRRVRAEEFALLHGLSRMAP